MQAIEPAISATPNEFISKFFSLAKGLSFGKTTRLIWPIVCLLVCLSYHSSGIRHTAKVGASPAVQPQTAVVAPAAVSNEKVIYLTFDDGPNRGTPKVVEVLEQEKVPATFFLVGSHVYGSERQWADFQELIGKPFLEAANHSFHHARNRYNSYYKAPKGVLADFQQMRDSLDFGNNLARTPGMDIWRTSEIKVDISKPSAIAADSLKTNGFTVVGWDMEWKADAKRRLKKSPQALAEEVDKYFEQRLAHTDDHLVVLLHDQHFAEPRNVEALKQLIAILKKEGYAFKRLSEYPCI